MADAKRDNNMVPTLIAVSNADGITPVVVWADPATHRLLTSATVSQAMSGLILFESDTSVSIAEGRGALTIPAIYNGYSLTAAIATVHTKGITGTTDVAVRRRRAGSDVEMLSTVITIGNEFFAADGVINTSNDDVATGDQIYVDVDAIHSGTAPLGLSVALTFTSP